MHSGYAASRRLEGFATTQEDAKRKLPTRERALSALRAQQD
ncbi:YhfG family protein [Pseudomonas sp. NCHU5208]